MKSLGLLRGEAGTQTRVVGGRTQAQILAVKGSWGQKGNNCNVKMSPDEQTLRVHLWSASQKS